MVACQYILMHIVVKVFGTVYVCVSFLWDTERHTVIYKHVLDGLK